MSTSASTSKRVAIITGAAEGIGRGIALRLAKDGFDLGLFDLPRSQEKLEAVAGEIRREYGARVVPVYGDVAREEDVQRLVETVVAELGSLYAVRPPGIRPCADGRCCRSVLTRCVYLCR